ncbi:MAG: hypothetical protein R2860_07015 [Desulfobacterales bacterium]
MVVSRMDGTLLSIPTPVERDEEKIDSQAEKSEYMRRFRRFFIGNAAECPLDKQGRVC